MQFLNDLNIGVEKLRDEAYSSKMAAYMKDNFTFLGIRSPIRKELFKRLWFDHHIEISNNFKSVVNKLWSKEEREYQYIAMDILRKKVSHLTWDDIDWIQELIVTNSWWDSIDFLAPTCVGHIFKNAPQKKYSKLDEWINNENKWLVRSAILFQLKYKHETDAELLFSLIEVNKVSKAFFIKKASGWALRQYSKSNPTAVVEFVDLHPDLSNLTKREALRLIN